MSRILIVEPTLGGHHGWYLDWLAGGLAERGVQSDVLTTRDGASHPSMQSLLGLAGVRVIDGMAPVLDTARGSLASRWQGRLRNFSNMIDAVNTATRESRAALLFPFLDPYAVHLAARPGALASHVWSGILMSPTFHQRRPRSAAQEAKRVLQQLAFGRLLSSEGLDRLFVIDPEIGEFAERRFGARAKAISYFHDPIPEPRPLPRDTAKRSLGLVESDVTLLAYGSLAARKGIFELLDALECPEWPAAVKVVLAGRPADSAVASRLATQECARAIATGRLIVKPYFVDDEEERLLFSAADLCWLAYVDFFQMSGVLVKAMSYGVAAVTTRAGLIGKMVETQQAGFFLDSMDKRDIARHMVRIASSVQAGVAAEDIANRARPHYVSAATASLLDALSITARKGG